MPHIPVPTKRVEVATYHKSVGGHDVEVTIYAERYRRSVLNPRRWFGESTYVRRRAVLEWLEGPHQGSFVSYRMVDPEVESTDEMVEVVCDRAAEQLSDTRELRRLGS